MDITSIYPAYFLLICKVFFLNQVPSLISAQFPVHPQHGCGSEPLSPDLDTYLGWIRFPILVEALVWISIMAKAWILTLVLIGARNWIPILT